MRCLINDINNDNKAVQEILFVVTSVNKICMETNKIPIKLSKPLTAFYYLFFEGKNK